MSDPFEVSGKGQQRVGTLRRVPGEEDRETKMEERNALFATALRVRCDTDESSNTAVRRLPSVSGGGGGVRGRGGGGGGVEVDETVLETLSFSTAKRRKEHEEEKDVREQEAFCFVKGPGTGRRGPLGPVRRSEETPLTPVSR